MRIDVVTIFPEMFESPFKTGVISKALQSEKVKIKIHNLRNFSTDKHKTVDDKPFGGIKGMVLKAEPIYNAIEVIKKTDNMKPYIILTSPQGRLFNQQKACELSKKNWLIIICGRYEGVDERVTKIIDEEISIGDYVLTGGELAAMVIIDAVTRLIPGVVKERGSIEDNSFFDKFLGFPVYTRPREFLGMKVPEVLLSGDHKKIKKWILKERIRRTIERRPDLINLAKLSEEEKKIYEEIINE